MTAENGRAGFFMQDQGGAAGWTAFNCAAIVANGNRRKSPPAGDNHHSIAELERLAYSVDKFDRERLPAVGGLALSGVNQFLVKLSESPILNWRQRRERALFQFKNSFGAQGQIADNNFGANLLAQKLSEDAIIEEWSL